MKQWRHGSVPAPWQCEMVFRHAGRMRVEVRHVSETAMRIKVERAVTVGDEARILVGRERIEGQVTRVKGSDVAVVFDRDLTPQHLASLRRYRRLGARHLG